MDVNLATLAEGGQMDWPMMLIMFAPLVIIMLWWSRSQKKRDEERRRMLDAVKKGDRVVTVGGIIGEVARTNEHEVVLIVDKAKNVEVRFRRGSIASVQCAKDGDESKSQTAQAK
jgi:preprotein translocase subunit YajC